MNRQIDIRIEEPYESVVPEAWIHQAVIEVLNTEEMYDPIELSLLITDDPQVHELNRTYRGIDDATDVLAFAFQEDMEFPTISDRVTQLGEVIISCPKAEKQAADFGHSLKDELSILVVHGVLHLLGYDHESSEDGQLMQARELKVLKKLQ